MIDARLRPESAHGRVAGLRAVIPAPVLATALGIVAVLLFFANEYGFHRDELYFVVAGQHPDWGYVDQPPLTPILSALGVALLGATPVAVRILPALVVGACCLLAALSAKEMGGGRAAQTVAAIAVAASGFLLAGHMAATATYDLLGWALVSWLVLRILNGADPRLWLAVGVVGGLALENKYTIGLLAVGLVVGLLVERRWTAFRSPWAWAAVAIALAIWAPNLVWQAAHDFPQLDMARIIALRTGDENRDQLVFLQLLLAGPLMWPLMLFGLGRLLLAHEGRPWRAFAWAYLVALALTYWQGGKAYYAMGLTPVLFAAGSVPVGRWLEHGRSRLRGAAIGGVTAVSGALMAVLVLPVLSPAALVSTGVQDLNKESGEQIGWPQLVAAVDQATRTLTPAERAHAVIVTVNYGQAGAIELLGTDHLPVFSGHNSYWDFGRPPEDTTTVVAVGGGYTSMLGGCTGVAWVDNGFGVPNDEQNTQVQVCRTMPPSWSEVWPLYRHLD